MIEETAIVISCLDKQARLEVQRQSSCGSCQAKSGCGTAVFSKTLGKKVSQITVSNTLNLHVGDKVVVGLQESALLTGSAIVYLLPLMMLLLFAIIGQWINAQLFAGTTEIITIGFAVAGFLLAMKAVSYFSLRIKNDRRFQPTVLRKLAS